MLSAEYDLYPIWTAKVHTFHNNEARVENEKSAMTLLSYVNNCYFCNQKENIGRFIVKQ